MTMTLIVLLSLHHTAYIYIFLRTRERTLLLNMINGLKFELEGKEYNQFTKLQTSFQFHWDLGEVKFYLILGDQKRKSQTGMALALAFLFVFLFLFGRTCTRVTEVKTLYKVSHSLSLPVPFHLQGVPFSSHYSLSLSLSTPPQASILNSSVYTSCFLLTFSLPRNFHSHLLQ